VKFELHESQLEIFEDDSRFKVVAAGRRFGKSHLAAVELIVHALQDKNYAGYDVRDKEVYYIAPTFEQGKKIMWPKLKDMGKFVRDGGIIENTVENVGTLTLVNGRRISIRGADRPDTLRGVGLSYVVLDEYAFMKPDVWQMIIRPALADVEGEALFIGTPDGKNHFYNLWVDANGKLRDKGWRGWQFESLKNPVLSPDEIYAAISSSNMSVAAARQEFGASFNSGGGIILREECWKWADEPDDGNYYIAVDLAGFTTEGSIKKGKLDVRDEHAIAICKVGTFGWWVREIRSGYWDAREAAIQIIKAYSDIRPYKLGIEKGSLLNAVRPYLEDVQNQYHRFFPVFELTSASKKQGGKEDRIRWALEGRLEKGRMFLNAKEDPHNPWQRKLIDQANDFPSPLSHDDLLDSLAYIDQIADVAYEYNEGIRDDWDPLDLISGL
jgi:Terminase large subunit, T4likevirus-type, N-terminal